MPLDPPTVILKTSEMRYGLVVESLTATAEVMIKDVGELLEGLSYLAGMTVLGNTQVAPLPEPDGLWSLAQSAAPTKPPVPTRATCGFSWSMIRSVFGCG